MVTAFDTILAMFLVAARSKLDFERIKLVLAPR